MSSARGRRLTDAQLREHIESLVTDAGGQVGGILIDGAPPASFPFSQPWRLFHYADHVKQTVARVLRKEHVIYRLLVWYEREHRAEGGFSHGFGWVLLLREDAQWLAPLNMSWFAPGFVHGKGCGQYGGWNDHVYLIAREHARRMLSSYADLHSPLLDGGRCWLHKRSGRLTSSKAWAATRAAGAAGMRIDRVELTKCTRDVDI